MPDPQQQQAVKPPPPPGYHDMDAKPAPPAGYHDVDAQPQQAKLGGFDSFSMDVTRGMGFDPDKIRSAYHEDDGGVLGQAREMGGQALSGLGGWAKNVAQDPAHIIDPLNSMASAITRALGLPDDSKSSIFDKNSYHKPNLGELVGASANVLGGAEAGSKSVGAVSDVARTAGKGFTPTVQKLAGVGEDLTRQTMTDWQGKVNDVTQSNRESLIRARGEHESKIADIENSNRTAQAEATQKYQGKVEATRKLNEESKQNALQKQQLQTEAQGHARELAEHLPKLADQERTFAKALYPDVKGVADAKEIAGQLNDVVEKELRGAGKTPPAIAKVIQELEPQGVNRSTGPVVGGRHLDLSNTNDFRAYQKFKEAGVFTPEEISRMEGEKGPEGLTFQKLHEHYSDLGAALSKDLPNDERAAISGARDVLSGEMRKMAEADKKLTQFTEAQKNWSKYENTFNKTWNDKRGVASPIAKALQQKNPVTGEMLPDKVQTILSKDSNYKLAQQLLSKVKGAKTDVLQLMKEKTDQAGTLPKGLKERPIPEMPNVPQKDFPDSQAISLKETPPAPDMQAIKADLLRKKAEGLGGFSGRGMFIDTASLLHFLTTGNPLALTIPIGRRVVAAGIKKGASGKLSGLTPAEQTMIKPSKVYVNKAAALAAKKP